MRSGVVGHWGGGKDAGAPRAERVGRRIAMDVA